MIDFKLISLEEAFDFTNRWPGLLLGPGATRAPGDLAVIVRNALARVKIDGLVSPNANDDDLRLAIDRLDGEFPAQAPLVHHEIINGLQSMKPSMDLGHLVKVSWSACISASEDMLFEYALRTHLDGLPSSRSATVIDHPSVEPPDRTIPVYKLLGNVAVSEEGRSVVLSKSELLFRKQAWAEIIRTLPDHIREAPLFILGASTSHEILRDVLGLLLGMRSPRVSRLIFLKDDIALQDPTIVQLCRRFNTQLIDGTLRDVCNKIAEEKSATRGEVNGVKRTDQKEPSKLESDFSSIVSFVPKSIGNEIVPTQSSLPMLCDALFRPNSVDWAPFLANLDFRRRATQPIFSKIQTLLRDGTASKPSYLIVHGEAGTGKTTTLKRVAIELANNDVPVVWCRRAQGSNWIRQYRALAEKIAESEKAKGTANGNLVVICDDAWALRLDPTELIACFDRIALNVVFIFGIRNSESTSGDLKLGGTSLISVEDFEFPFDLDQTELAELASMLVRIGAASSAAAAEKIVLQRPSQNADDVLCSLWYLLPETRLQLSESLQDEYSRLGSADERIGHVAAAASSAMVAKRAYEFVTVGSNLGLGIPVEVLVQALGVNYEEWLDTVTTGRPLWGLLYAAESEDLNTITYHTRNHVVTRVLLSLVNGGVGHTGELRVLRELLQACSVGSLVYRNFVVEVLVKARNKLKDFLDYEQGVELFDIARAALPYEDRVIEHHRGIWIQDVGRKNTEAYAQFQRALDSPVYPGADREAPTEYIHTSMAATVLKLIQIGEQDYATGTEQIKFHLRKATTSNFFNSHTSHVSAGLLFDMSKLPNANSKPGGALAFIVDALQEIEKAMQSIGSPGRRSLRYAKSLGVFGDLQRRILSSIPDAKELQGLASKLFDEHLTQVGFEVVARRMLADASESAKGKDFNEVNDYLNDCMNAIELKGQYPTSELLIARVDLMVRWQIQGFKAVTWSAFYEDLVDILNDANYQDDLVKRFYLGVAQFHLNQITEGHATFALIRRAQAASLRPNEIRAYLLDDFGNPRRLQGSVKKAALVAYFDVPELSDSFLIKGHSLGGTPGSTTHAYIGFSLNGPTAVSIKPEPTDYLLA